MRSLTQEEKTRSEATRKRANKVLSERRKSIKARMPPYPDPQRERFHREIDSIRSIKGLPARLKIDNLEIVVNYEMIQRYVRKLKRRSYTARAQIVEGKMALIVTHQDHLNSRNRGAAEFYELPPYQRDLLEDLPLIDLSEELVT